MTALDDARQVLAGVVAIAHRAGLRVPDGIALIVDPTGVPRHGAACATYRDGRPVIIVRSLPEHLDACARLDLRGVLAHEVCHHVAGIDSNHRKPFRDALAVLARAMGQPEPARCESDPRDRMHPRRWTGAHTMPHYLRPAAPRRIRQIRKAWGMPPAPVGKPVPVAERRACSVKSALLLASVVSVWASAV